MTISVTLIALVLRLINLGHPKTLIFDETYYVKEAYSLWKFGTERKWPDEPNPAFEAGTPDIIASEPSYVVHPPLGKWILSTGQMIFGQDSSFGWRFAAAVFGALSIFIVIRIAIRLFQSVWLGFVAGTLLTVDGEHFVHSRTGLLDLFLMFFIVLGFWLLLIDRDDARKRILSRASSSTSSLGPKLGLRPWRLAAGVALGCAMGVKWSGLYALAVFGIMIVLWDVRNRSYAGVKKPWLGMLAKDAVPAFLSLVPTAVITYVLTWSGWIFSDNGYGRQWAADNHGWWDVLPGWIPALANYHRSAYNFHVGLATDHPYMSNPWGWIVQWRPTSFYYRSYEAGQEGCTAEQCSAAITSVGNPVLWGLAALAIIILAIWWLGRRDWRAGAILAGFIATWAPWFMYQERTIFTFYTIVMVPFVVLAVTYCCGLLWGSWPTTSKYPAALVSRRALVGLILVAAVLAFAYFWPVYTGTTIPLEDWRSRMLNPTWI